MTFLDFKSVIQSVFYTVLMVFVLSTVLLASIYTYRILKFDEVKIQQAKNMVAHLLEIEDRFIVEEFMSNSFEAVTNRVKRALVPIGLSKVVIYIQENGVCKYSSEGECLIPEINGDFQYKYKVEVLGEQYGTLLLLIPQAEFHESWSLFDHVKFFFLPLFVMVAFFIGWFKYADKKIIAPYLLKLLELEKSLAVQKISRQVAHDIKSPLSVLETITSLENKGPQAEILLKNAIHRIREISSDLLGHKDKKKDYEATNLYLQAKKIIHLKSLEYCESNISLSLTSGGLDLFSDISKGVFHRVLSNLINNAFEALSESSNGKVEVYIRDSRDFSLIEVKDNGVGIPEKNINEVLKDGFTTKKLGNGLGLSKINEYLHSLGGGISIKSRLGKGTVVEIKLPKVKCPKWFTSQILINNKRVLCLEDDPFYHASFKEKLKDFEVLCFYDLQKFIEEIKEDDILVLDYDFKGKTTGLEFITNTKLKNTMYLVTNMDEDILLREECNFKEIKLVPKDLFFDDMFPVSRGGSI